MIEKLPKMATNKLKCFKCSGATCIEPRLESYEGCEALPGEHLILTHGTFLVRPEQNHHLVGGGLHATLGSLSAAEPERVKMKVKIINEKII